jgi:hypothetical protein
VRLCLVSLGENGSFFAAKIMELELATRKGQYCSIEERKNKHSQAVALKAGLPIGEPIPKLTGAQLNEYHNLLHGRLGVPAKDVQRVYREIKQMYIYGNEVEKARIAHNVVTVIESAKRLVNLKPVLQKRIIFDSQKG